MSWIPKKILKSTDNTEYTTKRRIIGRKFLFLHTVSHKLHILKFPQHVCQTYLLRPFPSLSLWSLQFFSPFYATLWPRDSPHSVAWRPVCQYKSSGASPLPPQWKWKQIWNKSHGVNLTYCKWSVPSEFFSTLTFTLNKTKVFLALFAFPRCSSTLWYMKRSWINGWTPATVGHVESAKARRLDRSTKRWTWCDTRCGISLFVILSSFNPPKSLSTTRINIVGRKTCLKRKIQQMKIQRVQIIPAARTIMIQPEMSLHFARLPSTRAFGVMTVRWCDHNLVGYLFIVHIRDIQLEISSIYVIYLLKSLTFVNDYIIDYIIVYIIYIYTQPRISNDVMIIYLCWLLHNMGCSIQILPGENQELMAR